MNCELHHGGNALANVANLHASGAMANCDYYEVIVNDESRNFGLLDPPDVDADGYVWIPVKPGLGVEIDFALLERGTVGVVE